MPPPIGFMLLTHGGARQIDRLVNRLNALYDAPPIVCHHDFSQSDLTGWSAPPNVTFVRPYVRTAWGTFSLIEAAIRLLEAMYDRQEGPRWSVLLSAADYPTASADRVLADLDAVPCDAHIQHKKIDARALDPSWYAEDWHRSRVQGEHFVDVGTAYSWYCTVEVPVLRRRLWRPALTRPFLPFSASRPCHAGSQWFTINGLAARRVLDFWRSDRRLKRHYRRVMVPDESYFQTVLASMPDLRLNNRNWRYTDWHVGQGHPKSLELPDVERIATLNLHFARKLDAAAPPSLVHALDALCR